MNSYLDGASLDSLGRLSTIEQFLLLLYRKNGEYVIDDRHYLKSAGEDAISAGFALGKTPKNLHTIYGADTTQYVLTDSGRQEAERIDALLSEGALVHQAA